MSVVISILLNCHHEILFHATYRPKKHDFIWCMKCNKYTTINSTIQDHSWRCLECQGSRHYKAHKHSALTGGKKHFRITGHSVEVLDGITCYYVFTEQTPVFPLFENHSQSSRSA